jgi:hypothetical protein
MVMKKKRREKIQKGNHFSLKQEDEMRIKQTVLSVSSDQLPAPGSSKCIWRWLYQEYIRDFQLQRLTLDDVVNNADFQKIIVNQLSENLETVSFPFSLAQRFHSILHNIDITDDVMLLKHARECFDTIAYSVINTLPIDFTCTKERLHIIFNAVDRCLLGMEEGSLYSHLYNASHRISGREPYLQQSGDVIEPTGSVCNAEYQPTTIAMNHLRSALGEKAPLDKLSAIVLALQYIAGKVKFLPFSGAKGDEKGPELDMTDPQTERATNKVSEEEINADTLIERLRSVLTTIEDAKWHIEAQFISSLIPEGDWLLGPEGYALATLQTALSCDGISSTA